MWAVITENKKGYSLHPETLRWRGKLKAMYLKHEQLVDEMTKRGYNHNSSLDKRKAAETARNVLRLSDSETNKIRAFNAGHALFLTKNHRIHAKFMPTLQEREMFDTRPLE